MVGRTNVGSGGNIFAVISVSYPVGATCTCSNGTRTLKARGTSGYFVFNVPSIGTWTVSINNGYSTVSKEVVITKYAQAENVNIGFYRLPIEYQEVEYLTFAGAQELRLNIPANTIYRVDTSFALTIISNQCLFASEWNVGGNLVSIFNSCIRVHGKTSSKDVSVFVNSKCNLSVSFDDGVETINGSTYTGVIGAGVSSYTTSNFCIGHLYGNSSGDNGYLNAKMYSFVIFGSGNSIMYNLIPCYRKSDNVAGMYDTVNDVFYTNSGTGSFSVGSDIDRETVTGGSFASIQVVYPAGNVCTCSNETVSFSTASNNGYCIFYVPYADNWTISCTDGENTISKNVTISTSKEIAYCSLAYSLMLYDYGDECTDNSGGITIRLVNSSNEANKYSTYIRYWAQNANGQSYTRTTRSDIDLSTFSKLVTTIGYLPDGSGNDSSNLYAAYLNVYNSAGTLIGRTDIKSIFAGGVELTAKEFEFPLPSAPSSGYPEIFVHTASGNGFYFAIYQMRLE